MPVASSSIIHMKVMSLCLFLGSSHLSFPHTHHDVYRSGPVFIISFIFVTVELISGLPSVMKISLLSYLQILCFHYFFSHLLLELWLNVIYLFQFIFGPIFNYNYFFLSLRVLFGSLFFLQNCLIFLRSLVLILLIFCFF